MRVLTALYLIEGTIRYRLISGLIRRERAAGVHMQSCQIYQNWDAPIKKNLASCHHDIWQIAYLWNHNDWLRNKVLINTWLVTLSKSFPCSVLRARRRCRTGFRSSDTPFAKIPVGHAAPALRQALWAALGVEDAHLHLQCRRSHTGKKQVHTRRLAAAEIKTKHDNW